MSKFEDAIHAYQQAMRSGDAPAMRSVLSSIPEDQLEEFLHALEAAGVNPKLDVDPARLQDALQRAGMGRAQAQSASILSAGSFADFIRMRMRENQKGPDTLLQGVIDDSDKLGAGEIDDIENWLTAIDAGDAAPFDISDEAMLVLARAVGSSPETLLALKEID